MTKHLRFLFVMLLAMIWSAGWAQEVTMNFTDNTSWNFSTDTKNTKSGTYGNGNCAVSLTGGNYYFTTNKCLMLKENGTLTFTAFDFEVEKIVVKGNTGGSKKTKQNIYVNDKAVSSETTSSKVTNTYIINDKYQSAGTIYVLKVSNANAQINEILIYKKESSSSAKTDTKVSFGENSGKTFTFTEGKYSYGTFTTPTATETTGVAGTIAYSSSNATAISVDASTGELTFLGYGEATITAKFTPKDGNTYAVSTDVYKVVNQVKKSSTILTFSGDLKSFDKANEYKAQSEIKDVPLVGSDGKTYIFNSNGGKSGSARFILPNQSKKGKLVSPEFSSYINGYSVVITYGIGSDGYPSISANGKTVKGTMKGNYDNGNGATLSLDVADGSAFTVTSGNALAISKIEITPNKVEETTTITLDENSESNTIEAKTGVNVTLKRTMVANEWNTICLPFDVSKEQAQIAFGEGVKIAELNAGSTGTTLSFNSVNEISATKPYLIKPSKENTSNEYVFKNVNVAKNDPDAVVTGGSLAFKGIFNMVDITKDITNIGTNYYAAFLGAGNKIYKTDGSSNKTKGFRAYFAIPNSASASALRVVIDGTATSIKNIDSEVVESDAPVYNLQGQRVDGNNLTPGIYVKAGKKFVVK